MSKFSAGSSRNLLDIRKKAARRVEPRKTAPARSSGSKPLRLKTRRRRKQVLMFCICLLCAASVVGGLGAASHLEKFAIKDISVQGVHTLAPETLVASAREILNAGSGMFFSRKNMFLYPRAAIQSTLEADFPRIKEVSVARKSLLASAVVVTVEERKPFATWCPGEIGEPSHGAGAPNNACYVMDSGGFIFSQAGDTPSTSYVFHGGLLPHTDIIGQTFLRGRIQDIVQFLTDVSKAGYEAQGLSVDSEKDFSVILTSGPKLLASFDMTPSDIIHNLQTALEADGLRDRFTTLQYIDLRFGNRVYYK